MAERKLSVLITGDASKARKALGDLEKTAKTSGGKTEKAIGGIGKALGGLGLGLGIGVAISEFDEAQKVGKQTEAVIKSTGGAANVTADQVGDLAAAMSKKSAIDDEAIQAGQNWLLTFKQVRNEAGKGNDIFNQASETMLDLSVAMGSDAKSAANLLGKALNDPISGMTALKKAGVTFTEQQKEQIRTLQQSGDMLGAQKIILKELDSQVGGSAEAQATAWGRTQVALGNLAETVGGVLAPAIEGLADATEPAVAAFGDLDEWQQRLALGLAGGVYAWQKWGGQAVETLFDVTNSSRDAELATSRINRTLAKGGTAVLAGVTAYNLTYEALEAMAGTAPDIDRLTTHLKGLSSGASDFDKLAGVVGASDRSGLVGAFKRASMASDDWTDSFGYMREQMDPLGMKMRDAEQKVDSFDKALAGMVESGNADQAAESFRVLASMLMDNGVAASDVAALMDDYFTALDDAKVKSDTAKGGAEGLTGALGEQEGAVAATEEVVRKTNKTLKTYKERVDDARDAAEKFFSDKTDPVQRQIEAERALIDLGDAFDRNGEALSIAGKKGQENRQALIEARDAAIQYANTLADTQGPEAARQAMEEYRLKLIDTLNQAGFTEGQVASLIEEIGLTPTDIATNFASNAAEERERVYKLNRQLSKIPGTYHAVVDVQVQSNIDALSLGSTLASLSGPYGASGGNASGGHTGPLMGWRAVNESGQEFFKPTVAGTVVPVGPTRNAMASGGDTAPTVVQIVLNDKVLGEAVIAHTNRRTRMAGGRSPVRGRLTIKDVAYQ